MTHHLLGAGEIAQLLGLSRQRVDQLAREYEDFPLPEVELISGRVWKRSAIEDWIRQHPDRGPGRRKGGLARGI